MSSDGKDSMQARSIEWHVRLRHADEATWEAFTEWLAEDPRHVAAYDAIERMDLTIEPLLPRLKYPAPDDVLKGRDIRPSRFRHWTIGAVALAASIAGVMILMPELGAKRYEVETGPGQHQVVMLDAGTQVILNGSTHITFDHEDPRFAALVSGEALFRVRHDGARPFRLHVGDSRVEDVGTVFNVVSEAAEVRVAVAEGKVVYTGNRK